MAQVVMPGPEVASLLRSSVHLMDAIETLVSAAPDCHRADRSGRYRHRLLVVRTPDGARFEITVRSVLPAQQAGSR